MALDLYLGESNTSDIGSIEDLYKSRTNMIELVDNLKLNIFVDDLIFIEKNKLFDVFDVVHQNSEFFLELNANSYNLYDAKNVYIGEFEFGNLYDLENLSIKLNRPSFKKMDDYIFNTLIKRFF